MDITKYQLQYGLLFSPYLRCMSFPCHTAAKPQFGTDSHATFQRSDEKFCSILHWGLEIIIFLHPHLSTSQNTRTAFHKFP